MTNTYTVAITRWFACPTPEAFNAWAEELSGAWISHSGLNPLLGEYHSDHSYTFHKAVEADTPLEAIRMVYEGVHRALARLGPREDAQVTKAIRVEVDIEDNAIEDLPVSDGERVGAGE